MSVFMKTEHGSVIRTENPEFWQKAEVLTLKEGKRLWKEQARDALREQVQAGQTVFTVLRSVSSSGMSRQIDVYLIQDDKPVYITGLVARLLDYRQAKSGALFVRGCGTDMGFEVVYSLSRALFPDGNPERTDRDAGYALKQAWI